MLAVSLIWCELKASRHENPRSYNLVETRCCLILCVSDHFIFHRFTTSVATAHTYTAASPPAGSIHQHSHVGVLVGLEPRSSPAWQACVASWGSPRGTAAHFSLAACPGRLQANHYVPAVTPEPSQYSACTTAIPTSRPPLPSRLAALLRHRRVFQVFQEGELSAATLYDG